MTGLIIKTAGSKLKLKQTSHSTAWKLIFLYINKAMMLFILLCFFVLQPSKDVSSFPLPKKYLSLASSSKTWVDKLHAACSIWKQEDAQTPNGKKPQLSSSLNRWCVTSCKVKIWTSVLIADFFYHMMLLW